jgi:hypothetical protein
MGVDDPQGWLKQSEPPVPPAVFQTLAQMGVDGRLIQRAIEVAQREDPQLAQEQGPNVQQMNGAMGVPEQVAA